MKKSEESLTSVQCFKVLELMLLIQEGSLMSQERDRMSFLAWIDLQIGFQIWVFKQNFQVCVRTSGAASWSMALGLRLILMYEWFRVENLIQNLCIHGLEDLIFKDLFSIFFHAILTLIISNQFNSFHIWSCTNYWVYIMHKKIEKLRLSIFHVFNWFKWIIINKNSNK